MIQAFGGAWSPIAALCPPPATGRTESTQNELGKKMPPFCPDVFLFEVAVSLVQRSVFQWPPFPFSLVLVWFQPLEAQPFKVQAFEGPAFEGPAFEGPSF